MERAAGAENFRFLKVYSAEMKRKFRAAGARIFLGFGSVQRGICLRGPKYPKFAQNLSSDPEFGENPPPLLRVDLSTRGGFESKMS